MGLSHGSVGCQLELLRRYDFSEARLASFFGGSFLSQFCHPPYHRSEVPPKLSGCAISRACNLLETLCKVFVVRFQRHATVGIPLEYFSPKPLCTMGLQGPCGCGSMSETSHQAAPLCRRVRGCISSRRA